MMHTRVRANALEIGDTFIWEGKPTLVMGRGFIQNRFGPQRVVFSIYQRSGVIDLTPTFSEVHIDSTHLVWRVDAEAGKVRPPYAYLRESVRSVSGDQPGSREESSGQ